MLWLKWHWLWPECGKVFIWSTADRFIIGPRNELIPGLFSVEPLVPFPSTDVHFRFIHLGTNLCSSLWQMSSTFFLQSVRMDVRIGSLVTPAAALNLFNIAIILILIPFMDRLVYPCLAKWGKHPTLLQRMGE